MGELVEGDVWDGHDPHEGEGRGEAPLVGACDLAFRGVEVGEDLGGDDSVTAFGEDEHTVVVAAGSGCEVSCFARVHAAPFPVGPPAWLAM